MVNSMLTTANEHFAKEQQIAYTSDSFMLLTATIDMIPGDGGLPTLPANNR